MSDNEIKNHRTTLGLTQAAFAAELGVSQVTVSNWEHAKAIPSTAQLSVIQQMVTGLSVAGVPAPPTVEPEITAATDAYGDWLANARSHAGLTRQELAQKAGVSQVQVFNIETGRTANPRVSTRKKLEKALGVATPTALVAAVEEESEIVDVGQFTSFDPHDETDFPAEPGVYVFYDISDRPIYVGESGDIRRRVRNDHVEKFWYKRPIVEKANYVRVEDQRLRRQLEDTLIKFLKSNAVINRRQVDR